jgi:Skp family chaperone for outer membrane proteins
VKQRTGKLWAWSLGAALVGVALGGVVIAQAPTNNNPAAAAAVVSRTRIAFVNLQEVIKVYPKYTGLQNAVKEKDKFYMDKLKVMDDKLRELQKKHADRATPETEKSKIEADARLIKVDMENLTNEAKKELIKFHDDTMSAIYLEINEVVKTYASQNGIDIVFRFTEDWTNETYYKPENVVRRMTLPLWPMYYDQNLNITAVVSRNLNAKYQAAAGAAPGGTAPGGGIVPAGGAAPATGGGPKQ